MTESQFIGQNKEKWKELEVCLRSKSPDPNKLHDLFIKVSSDLSYARTFYPNRSVRLYLNDLTQQVLDTLSTRSKRNWLKDVLDFFGQSLPHAVWIQRQSFYTSLFIFSLAVAIGVISSRFHPDFARVILGDTYINITEDNINNQDPMAIYKDPMKVDMFLQITANNLMVAFLTYVLGILGTMGTVVILIRNGIMLGTFQYFFFSKGLFLTSFLTIWIHGTIEISAIIIAGAAGLTLGSGLVFPGTHDRITSLQISAKKSLKILLGTVPLFVIAAILESFVTRHTEMPDWVKGSIILGSLFFIVLVWILLPWRNRQTARLENFADVLPLREQPYDTTPERFRSFPEIFTTALIQYKLFFGSYFKYIIIPGVALFAFFGWYHLNASSIPFIESEIPAISLFSFPSGGVTFFCIYWILITASFHCIAFYLQHRKNVPTASFVKTHFLRMAICSALLIFLFYFFPWYINLILIIVFPLPWLILLITDDSDFSISRLFLLYRTQIGTTFSYIPVLLFLGSVTLVVELLLQTQILSPLADFLSWHELFDYPTLDHVMILHLFRLTAYFALLPLGFFMIYYKYFSLLCLARSVDLQQQLEKFGQSKNQDYDR